MSPASGWKYLKMGECADCHESGARLFVPVLIGQPIDDKYLAHLDLVQGEHIPHFDPVCLRCRDNYALDIICNKHRLPLRAATGTCKLCLPAPKLPSL